jgi:hypothetical protein
MLHQTKKQYALRHFSWTPLSHRTTSPAGQAGPPPPPPAVVVIVVVGRRGRGRGEAVPPPPTASQEEGASCTRLRPTHPRPTAAATSQKWQRCLKSKVAKWERGRECFISCSQVAHLRGHKFISRNQYKITKSTAKKIFDPLKGVFGLLGQKSLKEGQKFQLFGNLRLFQ